MVPWRRQGDKNKEDPAHMRPAGGVRGSVTICTVETGGAGQDRRRFRTRLTVIADQGAPVGRRDPGIGGVRPAPPAPPPRAWCAFHPAFCGRAPETTPRRGHGRYRRLLAP